MASKGNFFSKFLSFFLVLIIISGVGFLGYSLISGSGGMNMASMDSMTKGDTNKTNTPATSNTTDSSSKDNMNMDNSSKDSMNMGNSSNSNSSNNSNSTTNQYSTTVINAILQNKDNIEKARVALSDSLKLMTLDPYGVDTKQENNMNGSDTQTQQNNGQNQTTTQQGTTVNVYPQNNTNTTMGNMGTTYDTDKMEKLHTGLYKVSIGVQLLDQLKNNLSLQLEQASMQVKDPSQYFYNQYLFTVQNKTKLTETLTYINEASSLVNINPYVSENGAVYDKDRMTNIHESIYKLAEVVIDLNKINDNFSNQAITLGNVTQNYINNNDQTMQGMNMNDTGFNIFGNVNMITVFNILVIVFIVIFIISILGFISRLLKSPRNND